MTPTNFKLWVQGMLLVATLLCVGAVRAEAATFTVTTTADAPTVCTDPAGLGPCSLRGAITAAAANGTGTTDTINFNLPGCNGNKSVACTIVINTDLPPLTSNVYLNGFSQPGANSTSAGSRIKPGFLDSYNPCLTLSFAGPDVAIDASGAAIASAALTIGAGASNVTIRGLAVYGVKGGDTHAIVGQSSGGTETGRLVEKNFVGTLQDGTDPGPTKRNEGFGIRQRNPGVLTASWNYVGYNGQGGIDGEASDSSITMTQNEAFKNGWNSDSHDGLDINGHDSLARCNLSRDNTNNTGAAKGDAGNGLEVGSKELPSVDTMDGNVATYNTFYRNISAGVSIRKGPRGNFFTKNVVWDNWVGISVNTEQVRTTNRNLLSLNSIFHNQGLGIDLQALGTGSAWMGNPDGITPNDEAACDADGGAPDGSVANTGSNDLQNYPVLTLAKRNKHNTTIQGYLKSSPSRTFDIEFYMTPAVDMGSSQDREGKIFLGHTFVTTSGAPTCTATFNVNVSSGVADTNRITATARIYEDDPVTAGDATTEPWSTSEFSVAIKVPQEDHDSDNPDSDCHDSHDQDCDGIKDEHDSHNHHEKQDSESGHMKHGDSSTYSMNADANSLLLIASVEQPILDDPIPDPDALIGNPPLELLDQPFLVEIYDPLGQLVASSLPTPGPAVATTVPLVPGVYTVKITNVGTIDHDYDSTMVTREPPLPPLP